ncbi:MAG: hypothetical protein MJ252_30535, partial [archaeon]|nr:hypothetical protein [archaeon]
IFIDGMFDNIIEEIQLNEEITQSIKVYLPANETIFATCALIDENLSMLYMPDFYIECKETNGY